MLRHVTRPLLLLSSKGMIKQFSTGLNKFSSYKPAKIISNNLLFSNNFTFSQLPKHKVLTMPALSPTMTEGKIVSWNVKEGDLINQGDVICQVQTDKATVGFESAEKGYIAKIAKSDGMITIGTPVVVLSKTSQRLQSFKNFQFGSTSSVSTPSQSTPSTPLQSTPSQSTPVAQKLISTPSSYPKHGMLKLPAVSPTMTQGKILQWKVKVGQEFNVGDSIFSIQTDKATVDYQATEKGYLAKVLSDISQPIQVGQPVAVFAKKQDDVSKFKDFDISGTSQTSAPTTVQSTTPSAPQPVTPKTQQAQQSQVKKSTSDRIFASPIAKKLAGQKGIALSELKGSGPQGRILKQDILSYVPATKVAQTVVSRAKVQQISSSPSTIKPTIPSAKRPSIKTPSNPFQQIPLSSMRKTIASRLTQSKTTIPHYYVQVSVEMGKVLELRQQLNKSEDAKISVNDIIVKAVALALRDIPDVNAQWCNTHVKRFTHADVSVAVATEGGLITPIVFRAQTLGLLDISKKTKDLAKRARQGKLDPSQFIGGTTTVSNLGMFGINSVTSVINPPQSTILGVGKTQKKVVFDAQASDPKAPYKVIDSMELIVSADHRVVDGALAARWVGRIKKYLQDPITLLL